MDWQAYLQANDQIVWQGRPAPRCYTFRNWKLALIGVLLFLGSSFWLMLGLQLADNGYAWYLTMIPLPLVVASFIMGPGQLLLARMEWERLFYCLTESKLLIQHGLLRKQVLEISRDEIISWQQKRQGEQLSSIRLQYQAGKRVAILHCLEQPQQFTRHLDPPTP
jgi:hypothetical protein